MDENSDNISEMLEESIEVNPHSFHPSLYDAETLLKLTEKRCVLPDSGGKKDFSPNVSSIQKVNRYYDELKTILNEERVCKKSALSTGEWDASMKLIRVNKASGPHWQRFGRVIDKIMCATPEEGLFLLEQGLLEIYNNGLPLSMQEAWALITGHLPSMELYHAYAHLSRLGFAVWNCSHDAFGLENTTLDSSGSKNGGNNSEENVTKDLNVEALANPETTEYPSKETVLDLETTLQEERSMGHCILGMENSEIEMLSFTESDKKTLENEEDRLDISAKQKWKKDTKDTNIFGHVDNEVSMTVHFDGEGHQQSRRIPDISDKAKKENDATAQGDIVINDLPLVHPSDAKSPEAILAKLQIIKSRPSYSAQCKQPTSHCVNVYRKTSNFKKSKPGRPDYRVSPFKYTGKPPNENELGALLSEADGLPLKLGVCNRGTVTFYSMMNVDVSKGLNEEEK